MNSVSLEKQDINEKSMGHPALSWREVLCAIVRWLSIVRIATLSHFALSVFGICALAPLSPAVRLERQVSPRHESVFASCRGGRFSERFPLLASLCQGTKPKTSTGDKWTSGRASGPDSPTRGEPQARSGPLSFAAYSSIPQIWYSIARWRSNPPILSEHEAEVADGSSTP